MHCIFVSFRVDIFFTVVLLQPPHLYYQAYILVAMFLASRTSPNAPRPITL